MAFSTSTGVVAGGVYYELLSRQRGRGRQMTETAPPPSPEEHDFASDIVSIAQKSDRAAFERLFRHFAPRVKSYLMRLGTEPTMAEEVMQEAMAQVWRKASLFDPSKASAATWIFTIARNQRIDSFRREKRPEIDPNDPALVPDDEPSPDHSISQRRMSAQMRGAIAELPTEQRDVLMLSFYTDIAHAEIADRLGIPLGTVKSRLRLAFRRLRVAMAEYRE